MASGEVLRLSRQLLQSRLAQLDSVDTLLALGLGGISAADLHPAMLFLELLCESHWSPGTRAQASAVPMAAQLLGGFIAFKVVGADPGLAHELTVRMGDVVRKVGLDISR